MPRLQQIQRHLAPRLREALRDTPAVLIHGPRQSGKTTLAKAVGAKLKYQYISFDDDSIRDAARSDSSGFVMNLPARVILDEVQRVPEIFTSLKLSIDARRTSGRFILTGSANVMLAPRLADSLTGRIGLLRLHPLSQGEIEGEADQFLDELFQGGFRASTSERLGSSLMRRVAGGGYPAALARPLGGRRAAWYRDYVDAQIQRDIQDLKHLRSFDVLPKILRLVAAYTSQTLNVSDLASPFELSRETIHQYVTLLERVFLVDRLPAWHMNEMSRIVKRSKVHVSDTGVACAILGIDAARLAADRSLLGGLLETFVLQELRRLASGRAEPVDFFHYRDRDGFEVDIVLERAGVVAGVEVKSASTVSESDLRGLKKLRGAAGRRFGGGVVLYDGTATIPFGGSLFAVPIRRLWSRR